MALEAHPGSGGLQQVGNVVLQEGQGFRRRFDLPGSSSLPQGGHDLFRGLDSHVPGHQDHLHLIHEVLVQFHAGSHQVLHPFGEVFPGLAEPVFQLFHKTHDSTTSDNFTDSTRDTPDSSMVTPWSTSAASMVPFRWVITMNWVCCP